MNRFTPGNTIELLRSGGEFFPALIDGDRRGASAKSGSRPTSSPTTRPAARSPMRWCARRSAASTVRVLVDGWGARHYLTPALERRLRDGGVRLLKYRPEVAPWQFRSHRLRRLHRKLCHVDRRVAFVGGINLIDDMNTPRQKPPRVDFAVRVERPDARADRADDAAAVGAGRAGAVRAQRRAAVSRSDRTSPRAGTQTAKFVIRDNLRHRRDIERAYLAAIRTAKQEILIANAYFFPGVRFRRALIAAAQRGVQRHAAAAGARRIPAAALRVARAVRPAAGRRRRDRRNTTARSCTRRSRSSTIAGRRSARRTSTPIRC